MEKKTLIILFVAIFLIMSFNKNQQTFTAYPPDTVIFRPIFDLPRDYSLKINETSGVIDLPIGTNLSAIESVSYTARGCFNGSGSRTFYISDKNFGSISFNTCQNLNFAAGDDEDGPFQHYEEKIVTRETIGSFVFTSPEIKWKIVDAIIGDDGKGSVIIQSHKITFNEKVGCTRSSQCPVIKVGASNIQATCSQSYHQCELILPSGDKKNVEDGDMIVPKEELENKRKSSSILLLIAILIGAGAIMYFIRKKS